MSASQTENARKIAEVIMRSLSSMMAEFRRGKDKKKRKSRTLLGSVGKGAAIGATVPVALGTLAGAGAAGMLTRTRLGSQFIREVSRVSGKNLTTGKVVGLGVLGGGGLGVVGSPVGALAGGAVGAGAYGINKLQEKSNKKSTLDQLLRR